MQQVGNAIKSPPFNYRIVGADYIRSIPKISLLIDSTIPEVAFIGRSNVGKSSLINGLCERKSLAQTSKTPGRTQMLNYFEIRFCNDLVKKKGDHELYTAYLVDLPGYGYAQVSKAKKEQWLVMLESYLLNSTNLRYLLLLIDSRREAGREEEMIAKLGGGREFSVVLTKCDKISGNELAKKKKLIARQLELEEERLICASTARGKKQGLNLLLNRICPVLQG